MINKTKKTASPTKAPQPPVGEKPKPPKMFGYKTYSFVDKDPIIDKLRTIIKDEQLSYKEICLAAGIQETTLMAWFHGLTRRPQFATIKAVCKACGYELEPTRDKRRLS